MHIDAFLCKDGGITFNYHSNLSLLEVAVTVTTTV